MIINQVGLGGGVEPTGTINITNNGSYSVTPYATADVNISGGGSPVVLEELNVTPTTSAQTLTPTAGVNGYNVVNVAEVDSSIDNNIQSGNIKEGVSILGITGSYAGADACVELKVVDGTLSKSEKGINIGGATDIGYYTLYDICGYGDSGTIVNDIVGPALINSSRLTTISGSHAMYNAFRNQKSITSTGLDSVKTINGYYSLYQAFWFCSGLTKTGLKNLETVSGQNALYYTFGSCTSLTDIELKKLKTISSGSHYYTFAFCSGLTIAEFDSLETITGNMAMYRWFWRCSNLKNIYFPSLKSTSFGSYNNQFSQMLQDVTGCTVHFPSNLRSVIGSWSDVTGGFSGTNTTVLFDLPATT